MAITKTSYTERVVIVLNADGTLKGAHQEQLSTISDDDVVLTVKQEAAAPLDSTALAQALPAQAALLADVQRLNDQLVAMTAERDAALAAKEAEISAKAAAIAQHETAMAAAVAQHETAMASALAQHEAAAAQLNQRIQALEAELHPIDENGFAVLSAVQLRLGLLNAGISLQSVDAVIAAIPDVAARQAAATYWEYAIEVHRDHPLVAQLAAALSLSDETVDQMWVAAAAL